MVSINLIHAAYSNDLETVKKLIESGVDPNDFDPNNMSALISASCSMFNFKEMCEYLLLHGANPNLYTTDKLSALKSAAKHQNLDIIKMLLEYGADPNFEKNGHVALNIFFDQDHPEPFEKSKEFLQLVVPLTDEKYYQQTYNNIIDVNLRNYMKELTPHFQYKDPDMFGSEK